MGRYIPPAWLQHTEVAEWAGEVEKLWPDLISKDLQELEILFVEQCRDRPMYVLYGGHRVQTKRATAAHFNASLLRCAASAPRATLHLGCSGGQCSLYGQ